MEDRKTLKGLLHPFIFKPLPFPVMADREIWQFIFLSFIFLSFTFISNFAFAAISAFYLFI